MLDQYNKVIASNLKQIASLRGKNQTDISRDLKISKGTVSCWFTARACPRPETIERLCEYLGCSRSELMEEHAMKNEAEETAIMTAYRNSDAVTQEMVRRILGVKGENNG